MTCGVSAWWDLGLRLRVRSRLRLGLASRGICTRCSATSLPRYLCVTCRMRLRSCHQCHFTTLLRRVTRRYTPSSAEQSSPQGQGWKYGRGHGRGCGCGKHQYSKYSWKYEHTLHTCRLVLIVDRSYFLCIRIYSCYIGSLLAYPRPRLQQTR